MLPGMFIGNVPNSGGDWVRDLIIADAQRQTLRHQRVECSDAEILPSTLSEERVICCNAQGMTLYGHF